MSTLDRVLSALADRELTACSSDHYLAQCPAHEDRNPSLSITQRERGLLLRCHAGCTTEDVVRQLGLTWPDPFGQ